MQATPSTVKINIALPHGCRLGDYRVLDTLGQGGFGITYLAEHVPTGKRVVIKENMPAAYSYRSETSLTVAPTGTGEEKKIFDWALERFLDEARLLAQLNHPNIVQVTEAFTALGTAYYVMEHIEGKVLHQAAPAPDKITEQWLRPVLRDTLQALDYVHGCNLLHRDVKPNNILLDITGRAVLIDFGTARSLVSERSATVLESPGYTPLEQLQSKGARGPWIDIYALGATCYRLLTGENPPRCLDRLVDDDSCRTLAQVPELRGRFSESFLQGIDRALSLNYKKRWQSATEWLNSMDSGNAPSIPTNPVNLPRRKGAGTHRPSRPQPIEAPVALPASLPPIPPRKGAGRGEWWFYVVACVIFMLTADAANNGFCVLMVFVSYVFGAYRRLLRLQRSICWLLGWPVISVIAAVLAEAITNSTGFAHFVLCFFLFVIPGLFPDPRD